MSDDVSTLTTKRPQAAAPKGNGETEYIVIARHSPWRLKQATIRASNPEDAKRQFREKCKAMHDEKANALALTGSSSSKNNDDPDERFISEPPANPIKAMKVAEACREEYREGLRHDKAGLMTWQIEVKSEYEARLRTLDEKNAALQRGLEKLILNQAGVEA